ncbi:MAG: alpha/beta fold hydrolase [Alphaproteobacteria bacterium]|nr:alpha/beta fold hydrolase [Alphaproteobacteria bacterium]
MKKKILKQKKIISKKDSNDQKIFDEWKNYLTTLLQNPNLIKYWLNFFLHDQKFQNLIYQAHKTANEKQNTHIRSGPRPLIYHMILALLWLGWLDNFLVFYKFIDANNTQIFTKIVKSINAKNQKLKNKFRIADYEKFIKICHVKYHNFLKGISAYHASRYKRNLTIPKTITSCGTTMLLDYAPQNAGPFILIIPSLINRAYILDLSQKQSLVRFLASKGFRPLLVDWGCPGQEEKKFTLENYIQRLEYFLTFLNKNKSKKKLFFVLGYCMGGLLATALAIRQKERVAGLICMATPWDFHKDQKQKDMVHTFIPIIKKIILTCDELPVDYLQLLFSFPRPFQIIEKFIYFSTLDSLSPKAQEFVMLEDWLNDGVPLVKSVALECFENWYKKNQPALGKWKIGNTYINPKKLNIPALIIVPTHDYIVPPVGAVELAYQLNKAELFKIETGHIGMITSTKMSKKLKSKLSTWISAHI